jgi:hypothetical protein
VERSTDKLILIGIDMQESGKFFDHILKGHHQERTIKIFLSLTDFWIVLNGQFLLL